MKKWNYQNLARLKLRKLLIRFMILSLVRDLLRDILMMKLSHKLSIHFWNSRSNIENSPLREFFLITEGTLGLFSVPSHFSPDRGRCRFATEGGWFLKPLSLAMLASSPSREQKLLSSRVSETNVAIQIEAKKGIYILVDCGATALWTLLHLVRNDRVEC